MIRRALSMLLMVAAGLLPASGTDWGKDYVHTLYDGRQLAPIEGVWQFGDHGAKVAIVKHGVSEYDIILLDSPRLDVPPGTLIGHAESTPHDGVYDARMENKKLGHGKIKSQTMVLTVGANGTLTVEPYKTGYSLSFKRWLSYLLRLTVTDHSRERPKGLTGARRIYPERLSDHYPISL